MKKYLKIKKLNKIIFNEVYILNYKGQTISMEAGKQGGDEKKGELRDG